MEAIEAGADDIEFDEGAFEIYTTPESFDAVCSHLLDAGYSLEESEVTLIPQNYSELPEDEEGKVLNLVDMLEKTKMCKMCTTIYKYRIKELVNILHPLFIHGDGDFYEIIRVLWFSHLNEFHNCQKQQHQYGI